MKKILFIMMLCGIFSGVSEAQNNYTYTTSKANIASFNNSTAQGVAQIMASKNYVGHFGGNNGYEGCGSGMTKQQAYNNCCFANSGMRTIDVGYAQSQNGKWYCCRRYAR